MGKRTDDEARDGVCVPCDAVFATEPNAATFSCIADGCPLHLDPRYDPNTNAGHDSIARRTQAVQQLADDVRQGKRFRLLCACDRQRCHGYSVAHAVLIKAGYHDQASKLRQEYNAQFGSLQPGAQAQLAHRRIR